MIYMKTTVEIPDGLFREAKRYAVTHDLPLRQVLESALRSFLAGNGDKKPFRLKRASFRGDGMVKDYSWPEIREIIYEERGS